MGVTGMSVPMWQNVVLLCVFILLLIFLVVCLRSRRRQKRREEEQLPLLDGEEAEAAHGCSRGVPSNYSCGDVAAIGTPARDFVRLSSLPASVFKSSDEGRRCMACSQAGECVALRPCGHAVLCRACSDFVYTCPYCGQYISGIAAKENENGSLRAR